MWPSHSDIGYNRSVAENEPAIAKRKADHLEVAASGRADFARSTLLEQVHLVHQALPELALDDIDLSTELVGKRLARAARDHRHDRRHRGGGRRSIATSRAPRRPPASRSALGSQRAMAEHPELAASYQVRDVAPDVVLFGNVGAVQALAMGAGARRRAREADRRRRDCGAPQSRARS